MNILVAGGAGYIGSSLIPKLLDRGYNISVIDLLWFGNHLPKSVKVLKKDVFTATPEDLSGYDQVIFLAGLSNDPMAEFSPRMNFVHNAASPAYLAYIAKIAGVKRFIYAGSCSVYGYTVDELYNEESPTICQYPYGISKLQGEQSVMQLRDDNFSVIGFRQGTVSGYSPRMRLDLVVNTMFKSAIQKGEINVSNPAIWRPVLSISDAGNAYIRAIEANYNISGIFNIASDNYTVGAIADYVQKSVSIYTKKKIKLKIDHIKDCRNYKVTNQKAQRVLSFKPDHDVKSILEDLIENHKYFKDLTNDNYYNIEIFKNVSEAL